MTNYMTIDSPSEIEILAPRSRPRGPTGKAGGEGARASRFAQAFLLPAPASVVTKAVKDIHRCVRLISAAGGGLIVERVLATVASQYSCSPAP